MAKQKKSKAQRQAEMKPMEVVQEVTQAEAAEHEQFEAASAADEMQAKDEIAIGIAAGEMKKEVIEQGHGADDVVVLGEEEGEEKANNSVVAVKFKDKYIANAKALGIPGKAAKRSNWDWLSQQIAAVCLDDKHKIRIADFTALLDANGVDHSKWTNRNKGWEGRFRMTGRVALQKVVANAELMKFPDFMSVSSAVPPADFVARFKTKE
jgi:hypothetical protein